MLNSLPRPAVIAHRGASSSAPENTLKAFQLAVDQRADALEIDVRLTGDGRLAVIHDATLNRTTSGTGRVSRLPLSVIQSFDAGLSHPSPAPDQRVPSLEEVLELFGPLIPLNIELKSPFWQSRRISAAAADVLAAFPEARVLVSSFNPACLAFLHSQLPSLPLGLLTRSSARLKCAVISGLLGWEKLASLHLPFANATPELIQRCHVHDLKAYAYTVNDPDTMLTLEEAGVDGLITDVPGLAVRTLGR